MSTPSQPISLRTTDAAPADFEVAQLAQQLPQGHFEEIRSYLSRTRASGDWQDRLYVLEQAAPKASIDALNAACNAEPQAPDLLVLRCAYFAELSKTMRGTGTSDQVTAARAQNALACVRAALTDMTKAAQLDAQDPTPYALLLKPLTIFSHAELQQKAFDNATAIAPDLVPAYFALITARSERWGGSHKASVDFARAAMAKARPGSDMAACLFWAHTLVRTHFTAFDKNPTAARLYATNPEVMQELNGALDNWLAPPYAAHRSSIPLLRHASEWYRVVMDVDRQKRVIALTGEELKLSAPSSPTASRPAPNPKGAGLLNWIMGGKR
jgi:hypothetical protein